MSENVVVIYSGVMDSFTVLHKALKAGKKVHALSFNYGQRHKKELDYAANVCNSLNVPHKIVDISAIKKSSITRPLCVRLSVYPIKLWI